MHRRHRWLPRITLNELLTQELRGVEGCEEAMISVGPSRDVGPGESNWCEFDCVVSTDVLEHIEDDRAAIAAAARGRGDSLIDRRRLLAAFASLGNLVDRLLCRGSTDCFGTLSRRWRLKKQTSPDTSNCDPVGLKQPTVSSVATSAITIGIGGPRHLSLFGARRRARRY